MTAESIATLDQPSNETQVLTRRDWAWAWGVALIAMLIRLPGCFKGFWIDEYYTLDAARQSLAQLVAERIRIGHFPVYFIYAKLSLLLGEQEWQLRLSSLLALGVAVLMLTGLLGALGLRRHLRSAWVLAIFQPYWVIIATEYRYMMPVVAAAAAAAWACVAYARRPDRRQGALLLAATLALVSLHPVNLFALPALLVFLALNPAHPWRGLARRRMLAHAIPLVGCMLAILPFLVMIRNAHLLTRPTALPDFGQRLLDLCDLAFGRSFFWHAWLNYHHLSFSRYIMPTAMAAALLASLAAARWELLRQGRRRAWHLILCLLLIFPAACLVFSALVVNIQGSERYWCLLSLPLLLLLAVGWNAPLRPRWRRAYRGLIVFVVGMQFTAATLDRGDLQREAAQWIIRQHGAGDTVLVSRGEAYLDVFHYLGFNDWKNLEILRTYRRPTQDVARSLRLKLLDHPRLLVILYHARTNSNVCEAIKRVEKQGKIADWRLWELNKVTTVAAIARDPGDVAWLRALPELVRPWGPSRGDA